MLSRIVGNNKYIICWYREITEHLRLSTHSVTITSLTKPLVQAITSIFGYRERTEHLLLSTRSVSITLLGWKTLVIKMSIYTHCSINEHPLQLSTRSVIITSQETHPWFDPALDAILYRNVNRKTKKYYRKLHSVQFYERIKKHCLLAYFCLACKRTCAIIL